VTRPLFLILGLLFVGLGVVGAFLPLMPTTVFLILAAGCFARSSPRLEAWLMNHPRFGPTLRAWRENGAIPRKAKVFACLGMAFGLGLFFWAWIAHPHRHLWVAVLVTIVMAGSAAFVVSRPEA
jgi:uncharacterized membrane protein YbaN (DUF454 family)